MFKFTGGKLMMKDHETVASSIEHTLLRPDAGEDDLERLCKEAVQYGFHAVCVNPSRVGFVREYLMNRPVRVCTVVGFPLGATLTEVKVFEAMRAVESGADEIDMVMNVGLAKEGRWNLLRDEIQAVALAIPDAVFKVIIETGLLDQEEIITSSRVVEEGGAGFVKTSTGYGPRGATLSDIQAIKEAVSDRMGIKASGGIRELKEVLSFLAAGASRIGTSAGVKIMEELRGAS